MASQPDLVIRSGSVEFFGQVPPAGEGFIVAPDGIDGLDDGVASKGETIPRPQAHGDFDVPGFLDSRIVPISGSCIADSAQKLDWFGALLRGAFAEGSQQVVFDHMGHIRWGMARLAPGTTPKFKVNASGATDAAFQIQLKFANPRLFGTARTFAGGDPAFHYGNFSAAPVLTVTGSEAGGYTISGPFGKQYIVTRALVSGHPHTIDMATGLLEVDGVVVFGGVSRADTWAVPAGSQVTMTVSGSAVLSALVTDTYI